MPVQVYFTEAIPLTAVGKVSKPALRFDAARRAVDRLLAGLGPPGTGILVEVGLHAEHGSVIKVRIEGVDIHAREFLPSQISARLEPLTIKSEVVWGSEAASSNPSQDP